MMEGEDELELEYHSSNREEALRTEMEAFLDNLTELTRATNIIVSSDGNLDVNNLRKVGPKEAASGRYIFFDAILVRDGIRYPVDFLWAPGTDDPDHLVEF